MNVIHKNRLSIAFLLALFLQAAMGFAQDEVNKTDAKGLKQGKWVKYHDTKFKRYEGQFVNDLPTGTFKYYDNTGICITQLDFLHADTSEAKHFHTNGKVLSQGIYVQKMKHGEWRFYDERGVLSMIEHFEFGKRQGFSEVYYSNGKLASKKYFENDLEQGEAFEYFEDGVVKFQGTYINGNLEGEVSYFHPNKNLRYKGLYRAAVKDGRWIRYDEDGRPQYHEMYDMGWMKEVIDLDELRKTKNEE